MPKPSPIPTATNPHDERLARLEKLKKLHAAGINPFPAVSKKSHSNKAVLEHFDDLAAKQKTVWLTGRLRLIRQHGGITFAHLEDDTAKLQLLFKKDVLGPDKYKQLELLDIGDIVQAVGVLVTTKTGEKTLQVQEYTLLTKSLRPLPDKWHGLKDMEERFRHRYVDLIVNPETKEIFRLRSKFIKEMRNFLDGRGFMEVETPVLEAVPGGAEATPFITHHNTLDIDLYMRISLELYLKRISVGGFEKIYEIGPVFRNEGVSTQHLQEFTEMEFYWEYADYNDLMSFVEEFYSTVIKNTFGTLKFEYQGTQIDFTTPWPRLDYVEVVKEKTGIDLDKIKTVDQLKKEIKNRNIINIEIEPHAGLGRVIDQLYKKTVRPQILQPTLLINHPLAVSPLAKKHRDNPARVERVQVLFMGAEVGNGWSELNDPIDQKERFLEQAGLRESGDTEAMMIDEDFVEALEYGLPPTAGFGVGIDRMLMYLVNAPTIREVVFFPVMRPKEGTGAKDSDKKSSAARAGGKKKNNMKTVLVWGTFDILHLGHIKMLEEARRLGDKLVVLVSRDKIVEQVKGSRPMHDENERLEMISALKCVDAAYLDREEGDYQMLERIRPDVICLGYDQVAFTEKLPDMLKKFGIKAQVVRLKSTTPEKYKSSKIKEKLMRH
ncbi:lysine--tRNA ligase [Candidatus Uhrbacteria bacterium]|nr:lysine--tRNA ligase [Candidatus Uhrbacteria bacterium]